MKRSPNENEVPTETLRSLDQDALVSVIVALREQVMELQAEVQVLKEQLGKNSGNSGNPPSSDGYRKVPRSQRQRGQRRTGGQAGHAGRTLAAVREADHVVHHAVVCVSCQRDLRDEPSLGVEKRQVFDLPMVRLEVTEHQAATKGCPQCGKLVSAVFPAEVRQAVQYGPVIKQQMVYLTQYQLVPLARTCDWLEDAYGHRPSEATVVAAQAECAEALTPFMQQLTTTLRTAEVVHLDETGMRVEGRLHWLHSVSTTHLTHYAIHPKRGQHAMTTIDIVPHLTGWAVHDGWSAYPHFTACQHALCNAHLLRDLRFVEEQPHQLWAKWMAWLLLDMKQAVAACPPTAPDLSAERLALFSQRYDDILAFARHANPPLPPATAKRRGRVKRPPAYNLLDRLTEHKSAVLAFLHDSRVPFDNNLAERDLRMMKVKQKVSGSFRSQQGAHHFCVIRSYLSTVRKHGLNVMSALNDAFRAQPFIPA